MKVNEFYIVKRGHTLDLSRVTRPLFTIILEPKAKVIFQNREIKNNGEVDVHIGSDETVKTLEGSSQFSVMGWA